MKKAIALLCAVGCLYGSSVRLMNDSPYMLRAVVQSNDGSFLGEVMVPSQHAMTWTDDMTYYQPMEQPNRSQSPFTVMWYCSDGASYSISTDVANASTVTAQTGSGARICKQKPKTQGPPQSSSEESSGG